MFANCGRFAAVLAAALALGGCAGPQGAPNAERSFSTAKRTTGMLAASVTVSGYTPGSIWIQLLRSGDTAPLLSIPVNVESFGLDWNPGTDTSGRSFRGRLAAIELAPGQYEFGRWVMNVGNSATYISNGRVGVRATVKPGEVVYAGNIHIDLQQSASGRLPSQVDLNNEAKRDLPLLGSKYPELKLDVVRVDVDSRGEPAREATVPRVRMEDLDGLIRAR